MKTARPTQTRLETGGGAAAALLLLPPVLVASPLNNCSLADFSKYHLRILGHKKKLRTKIFSGCISEDHEDNALIGQILFI